MALSPELLQFKSSGVYRLEFDKSQIASIPAEQIRLVVGFSKQGPFNTPVFVSDTGFFTNTFGAVDRALERKGSFFHRTALSALERGPILALNLLRLNNDLESASPDIVDYQTLSTSSTDSNPIEKTALFSGFYNKDKFWFPEDKAFLNNIGELNTGIIQFVNLKQSPITIFSRKAQNVKQFDILAKSWYGAGSVPAFMNEFDYISDYMIDVFVIAGDFSNYAQLAIDPIYGPYFDASKGLLKASYESFLALPSVSVLAQYTGCLIPDFIDLNGNNLFIQDLINFDTAQTGLLCAINKAPFDGDEIISGTEMGVDLVGHNIENKTNTDPTYNRIKFLSYDRAVRDNLQYLETTSVESGIDVNTSEDISFYTTAAGEGSASQVPPQVVATPSPLGANIANYVVKVSATHSQYSEIYNNIEVNIAGVGAAQRVAGSYILFSNLSTKKWAPVVSVTEANGYLYIGVSVELTSYELTLHNSKMYILYKAESSTWHNSTYDYYTFNSANQGYIDWNTGITTSGDVVYTTGPTGPYYLTYTWSLDNGVHTDNYSSITAGLADVLASPGATYYDIPSVIVEGHSDYNFSSPISLPDFGNYLDTSNVNPSTTSDLYFVVQSLAGAINESLSIIPSTGLPANEVLVDYSNPSLVKIDVGDYLVATEIGPNGESRLTKVKNIVKEGVVPNQVLHVYCDQEIKVTVINPSLSTVERYRTIESVIDSYKLFALNGFTLNPLYHVPDGTEDRMNLIIDETIGTGTNLFTALTDKDAISFRYLVDGFGLGIQPRSKYQFTELAKARQNALAILNAPSAQDFKNSLNPRFTTSDGILQARLIADGGDLTLNPTFVYGLPSVSQGSSYGAFYSPYLVVRDRGKNITVPPAGLVSNNFIDKYSNALPWSIVAGPRRGVLTGRGLIGLEVNWDKDDRDYIEPFGLNPIIFQRGVGIEIHGNKTAQQNIKSALSSVHVREVLIYIQDGIAAILKNYLFEFNTAQTRLEIKTLADNFLNSVKRDQGVYDFKNVMDTTNNTPDVIDNNMGILDTYVEPVKGLEILVHRTTILRTGSIATGQFA